MNPTTITRTTKLINDHLNSPHATTPITGGHGQIRRPITRDDWHRALLPKNPATTAIILWLVSQAAGTDTMTIPEHFEILRLLKEAPEYRTTDPQEPTNTEEPAPTIDLTRLIAALATSPQLDELTGTDYRQLAHHITRSLTH